MISVSSPATLHELSALAYPAGIGMPSHFRAMVLQLVVSDTVAIRHGDRVLVVLGFWKLEPEREAETLFELWFVVDPEAWRWAVPMVRLVRLTLQRLAETQAVRIRAHVREGHRPGQRLARLVGMKAAGSMAHFEIWEWSNG